MTASSFKEHFKFHLKLYHTRQIVFGARNGFCSDLVQLHAHLVLNKCARTSGNLQPHMLQTSHNNAWFIFLFFFLDAQASLKRRLFCMHLNWIMSQLKTRWEHRLNMLTEKVRRTARTRGVVPCESKSKGVLPELEG